MSLMDTLEKIASGATGTDEAPQQFGAVAHQVPSDVLAGGIAHALRSDATPPFPQMVGQLFDGSNPQQRAGLLGELLRNVGPQILSSIAGGALGGSLGGILGRMTGAGGGTPPGAAPTGAGAASAGAAPAIPPDVAAQVTPQQAQDIAHAAEKQDPGVLDRIGQYYAQHPDVVKVLGAGALAIALGHIAQRMK